MGGGIEDRYTAINSDNGAEMCTGMHLLESDLYVHGFHLKCMARVVNLAARAAFKKIGYCIESVRKLLGAIRLSVKKR